MKNIIFKNLGLLTILLLYFFLVSNKTIAQVPNAFSYQAVVRDSNNELVKNTNVGVRITIGYYMWLGIPPQLNFITEYSETHSATTNENGMFTLKIGGGTVVHGKFDSISWDLNTHYIQTEIDPAGGTDYTISSTTQILSVPYALVSKKSEKADTARFANNGIIAYGNIKADGTIDNGSNNYTVTKPSTGRYEITWNSNSGINTLYYKAIVSVTPLTSGTLTTFSSVNGGATLIVFTTDSSGNGKDARFSFVVFKTF